MSKNKLEQHGSGSGQNNMLKILKTGQQLTHQQARIQFGNFNNVNSGEQCLSVSGFSLENNTKSYIQKQVWVGCKCSSACGVMNRSTEA